MLYDREAPLELRIQDAKHGPQEVGSLEAIRVKVLLLVSYFKISNLLRAARDKTKFKM